MYKIYKIVDNTNGNVYIGQTTQTLKQRLARHRCDKTCTSRDIIKNGDYEIILIEETDDKTRERYWILNTECINIQVPGRTQRERDEENIDKVIKYKEKYYENNKELCIKRAKEHRQQNIDKVREYDRKRSTIKNNWMSSMGGRINQGNNSLLKIDPNLFLI